MCAFENFQLLHACRARDRGEGELIKQRAQQEAAEALQKEEATRAAARQANADSARQRRPEGALPYWAEYLIVCTLSGFRPFRSHYIWVVISKHAERIRVRRDAGKHHVITKVAHLEVVYPLFASSSNFLSAHFLLRTQGYKALDFQRELRVDASIAAYASKKEAKEKAQRQQLAEQEAEREARRARMVAIMEDHFVKVSWLLNRSRLRDKA